MSKKEFLSNGYGRRVQQMGDPKELVDKYVGVPRQVVVNTTENRLHVMDGETPGGHPVARLDEVQYETKAEGGVVRTIVDKLSDTVSVRDFGAKGDGISDDTAAIQKALDTGRAVFIPEGVYVCSRELELTHSGQKVFGCGPGAGYRGGNFNSVIDYHDITTLLFVEPKDGTGARRVRTRVKYRASKEDPQDSPLSVCLNVQAENVVLEDFCLRLNTIVSAADRQRILSIDASTADEEARAFLVEQSKNLGADWDIGVFVGTRLQVKLHRVNVIGYFREADVWVDATNGHNLPRFPSISGTTYPSDNVNSGSDGFTAINCMFFGGLWGVRVQGAEPKTGEDGYSDAYYDEILGKAVTDKRGGFGCSDLCLFGCQIYGPQHYSHLRRVDMSEIGDPIADVAKGGAFSIGGLAGNGTGRIHGHRYIDCRFASNAPFCVRVDRSSRDLFLGCTLDNEGQPFDTQGNPVEVATDTSFNGLVLTANSQRCRFIGSNGNAYSTYTNFARGRHTVLSCDSDSELKNYLSAKFLTVGNFDSGGGENAAVQVVSDPGKVSAIFFGDADNPSRAAFNFSNSASTLTFGVESVEYFRAIKSSDTTAWYVGGSSGVGIAYRGSFSSIYSEGQELIRLLPDQVRSMGSLRPGSDGTALLGTGSARWSEIFAATGTINTSDAREKTAIEDTDEALMRAWSRVRTRVFQFKDAVAKKSAENARLHVGVIAQEVVEAFAAEGLDATRYGLLCHDVWEDEYEDVVVVDDPEVLDEEGGVVTPTKSHVEHRLVTPAGDRYGIRYEEALALECAYLRHRMEALENRLSALESA